MANIRLFLWISCVVSLWVSYTTWSVDNAPPPSQVQPAGDITGITNGADPSLPDVGGGGPPAGGPAITAPGDEAAAASSAGTVRVTTDVLDVLIDLAGGDLVRVDLPVYPVHKDDPEVIVRLIDNAPATRWIFQTGLRSADGGAEPNHLAVYRSDAPAYALAPGADTLTVTLEWQDSGALAARKVYSFARGSYQVGLELVLENGAATPWRGAAYSQMLRRHTPPKRSYFSVDSYSFTGPVLYDGDGYDKLDVGDLATRPIEQTLAGGWYAGIQHHFLAAAVPPPGDETHYQAAARGEDYVLTAVGPLAEIAAGASLRYPLKLFVGPKLQDQLAATGEDMELAVDYGILSPLALPLFWVLDHIHGWVGNWGWSIIICTLFIKLAFYKLTAASGRSMAKMRKFAPRMKALQERFKDDRQGLSQAMMELYKREKVNPAAGCLPILIQMPFFFAYYWVLLESVEMRQAPFMLWLDDLSARDPFFILPIFMVAAMWIQMRLSPTPPDAVQARIVQIMPLVFGAMFAFFPSGLVLYWLTNTLLSILQQWRINTLVARES